MSSIYLPPRRPPSLESLSNDFLPAVLCYYTTAFLVLAPNTLGLRFALLPITLWSIFRASIQLDFAFNDEGLAFLNQGLLLVMSVAAMRSIIWTFQLQPLEKELSKFNTSPSRAPSTLQHLADAFDLSVNMRGIGWKWSEGLRIPEETRDVTSSSVFMFETLRTLLVEIFLFDLSHYAVQSFGPSTIGSPLGGSIYASHLHPVLRYGQSSFIVILAGFTIYFGIQIGYNALTLVSVGLFRQSPTSWPPVSNKPWLSTSLNQFWTLRWHQTFRNCFISIGGKPFHFLLGRAGGVIGAFLVSGILHDLGLWGMGRGNDFASVGGFFVLMGVGVVLECTFKSIVGQRVDGFWGWLWTTLWVVGWGNLLVNAWAVRGLVGSQFIPDPWRPSTLLFGSLVSSS